MDHQLCTNDHTNICQRSHTWQPFRCNREPGIDKRYMINKYFESLIVDKEKYANMPPVHNESQQPVQKEHNTGHTIQPSPYGLDCGSQSQHHCQNYNQADDPNNYYNMFDLRGPNHRSTTNETLPMIQNHGQVDSITVLQQAWTDRGNLDTEPPLPSPRKYSIASAPDGCRYKVKMPHRRLTKFPFTDPKLGVFLRPGSCVTVLHPSKQDRSKFTVLYQLESTCMAIDIPQQITAEPSLMPHYHPPVAGIPYH